MESPNFERLAKVFYYTELESIEEPHKYVYFLDTDVFGEFCQRHYRGNVDLNNHVEELKNHWQDILEGKNVYPDVKFFENSLLDQLLKDYDFENLKSDFSYLGFRLSCWVKVEKDRILRHESYEAREFELLQALNFLNKQKGKLRIEIKSQMELNSASITDEDLISAYKKVLYERFKEKDTIFNFYLTENKCFVCGRPFDTEHQVGYISQKYEKEKTNFSGRGRKKGFQSIKQGVYILWRYLQDNTNLKDRTGTSISRKQANFIYKFFKIYELIEEKSRKEDTISYYFKDYRNSKIGTK